MTLNLIRSILRLYFQQDLIRAFIDAGAKIQIPSDDGNYPLSALELAVQNEDQNILRLLVDSYGKPSSLYSGQAFHYAIQEGKESMVRLLLLDYELLGEPGSYCTKDQQRKFAR